MNSDAFNSALPPGTKLLWFEIIRVLGKGGFGITYLGRDIKQNQEVAIKEYLPTAFASRRADNEVFPNSPEDKKTFEWGLDSFLKEAQTVARFKHSSIVRVISFFRNANTAYMVMEYVNGEGLDAILKRRKTLSEVNIKRILPPLLDGLELLHKAAYIHRDIKPPNILIRNDGSPVILDFGSARQSIVGQNAQMTSLLSLGYSPFEQYDSSGDRQGAWSDIYAMAGVLYRCIVGDKPPDASLRIAARLRSEPDPMKSAEEMGQGRYSAEFLKAVDWGLMVMEKDRPQSIQEWRPRLLGISQSAGDSAAEITTLARPQLAGVSGAGEAESAGARKKSSWRGFISSMNEATPQAATPENDPTKIAVARPAPSQAPSPLDPSSQVAPVQGEKPPIADVTGNTLARNTLAGYTGMRTRKLGSVWVDPVLKMEFVWLPGGTFKMGALNGEYGRRPDEVPQHEVQLDGFWISKYLVTWGRWNKLMPDYPAGQYRESKQMHPVAKISWHDVQKFLAQFNAQLGEGITVRLPTEAEWEYAARAGHRSSFSTGDMDHWSLTDYAWVRSNSGGQLRPVGGKSPNDWGLYDMDGNVREWTDDRYQMDYYAKSPVLNPRGGENDEARVVRGSGFKCKATDCRVARRMRVESFAAYDDVGFRVVRAI
ncbi:MAG: SUMF1/EgtB/PvdO family nonheme iron enzyme [Magnetococcales bacterium]|nr:SUMF1/EgtB/PvdO family nonheme iron enzyme [Magnetococcales bacterium]